MGAEGQNRLCIVDHLEIKAGEVTVECVKCKVPYHEACWEYIQRKCAFQICAWGRVCPIDQVAIPESEASATCSTCQTVYHQRCWTRTGRCSRPGCSSEASGPLAAPRGIFRTLRPLPEECWPCGHGKEAGATECRHCASRPPALPSTPTQPPSVGCSVIGFGLVAGIAGLFLTKNSGQNNDSLAIVGILSLAGAILGGFLAKRAQRIDAERKSRIPPPPKPSLAPTLLSRSLERLAQGELLGAEADATSVLAITPQSCEAFLLRSAARYPANVEGSYLDLRKAAALEPTTVEGYALLLHLRILYFHLSCLIPLGNLGNRFAMPQTSLTLGAEALLEGRMEQATSHFRSALEFPGDEAWARLGLALVVFWQGDLMETIRRLRDLQAEDPRVLRFQSAVRMIAR